MLVDVTLLDGSTVSFDMDPHSSTEDLLESVAESLDLYEKDYFGLLHRSKHDKVWTWLKNDRKLQKQLANDPRVFLQVKFYPPEPDQLMDDLTRYLMCLQIQTDVKSGKLPCSFATHAQLGAYLVQSELGDYNPAKHGVSISYLRAFDFAPAQSDHLLHKIMEVHKTMLLTGPKSAEAEQHYLQTAKKLAMYGVSLHHAKDTEGVSIMLGVCSSGLLVYRDRLRINRIAWPKIVKISYKRNGFFVKLSPGEFEVFESTIAFRLGNHRAAERLWKISVEHHSFFRLLSPKYLDEVPPKRPRSWQEDSNPAYRKGSSRLPKSMKGRGDKRHKKSHSMSAMGEKLATTDHYSYNPLEQHSAAEIRPHDQDDDDPGTPVTLRKRGTNNDASAAAINGKANSHHSNTTSKTAPNQKLYAEALTTKVGKHDHEKGLTQSVVSESIVASLVTDRNSVKTAEKLIGFKQETKQKQTQPAVIYDRPTSTTAMIPHSATLVGEVMSSQTITSRSRVVETTTYSLEKDDGGVDTRVEQRVTIKSDGDPIDHDEALARAIQEAMAMNPDMMVEKIEIHQSQLK